MSSSTRLPPSHMVLASCDISEAIFFRLISRALHCTAHEARVREPMEKLDPSLDPVLLKQTYKS